ncbi:MAG: YceI family protein [candidate division Zixibacteria bacterium]|nr:YceI family protein [candidate division Zixibacteria bacterium]
MFKRFITAGVLLLAMAATSQAEQWTLDKAHSSISFSVRHLVVSKTRGHFNDFNGTVDFDGKDLAKGRVEFTVQTASIDTDNQNRDDHLRSDDFFNVEKFPTMTFVSRKVEPGEGNKFKLIGDLTIRDVTKEVTFDGEFSGAVVDPWGNTKAGFSAQAMINRQDFNVKWNQALDAGGFVVGDDVNIFVELEMQKS